MTEAKKLFDLTGRVAIVTGAGSGLGKDAFEEEYTECPTCIPAGRGGDIFLRVIFPWLPRGEAGDEARVPLGRGKKG